MHALLKAMTDLKGGNRAAMLSALDSAPTAGIREAVSAWRWMLQLRLSDAKVQLPCALEVVKFTARLSYLSAIEMT